MGIATAAVVVAAAASAYGASQQASATRSAANSAHRDASDWNNYVAGQRNDALQAYQEYSPAQQAAVDKSLQSQTANVQRYQKLLDSIDPSLIEAGKQMHSLLQGQSAPVLQNLKDQRGLQRQTLLDTLRQQYGPGAEASSMGMNALNKFDSETANQLTSAQQSYLQQVSGIALGGGADTTNTMNSANSMLANLGNQYGQIGMNKANIMTGTLNANAGAEQAMINTAGGNAAGQAIQGQAISNFGTMVGQGVGAYMGSQNKPQTPVPDNSLGNNINPVGVYSGQYGPVSNIA